MTRKLTSLEKAVKALGTTKALQTINESQRQLSKPKPRPKALHTPISPIRIASQKALEAFRGSWPLPSDDEDIWHLAFTEGWIAHRDQ